MTDAVLYQTLPPGAQSANAAFVAAAPPVGARYPQKASENNAVDMGLMAADLATGLLPNAVSLPAGAAIGAVSATRQANREKDDLLGDPALRAEIAAALGVRPEEVTEGKLHEAVARFPGKFQALEKVLADIEDPMLTTPTRKLASMAGGVAGGAAAGLLGLPLGWLTGIAGFEAGSRMADFLFSKLAGGEDRERSAYAALKKVQDDRDGGMAVAPLDIFRFHVAVDPELALRIEERRGKPFHDLELREQASVMLHDCPKLTDLCRYEAALVNSGDLAPKALLCADVTQRIAALLPVEAPMTLIPSYAVACDGHAVAPMTQQITVYQTRPAAAPLGPHTQALAHQPAYVPNGHAPV